MTSNVMRWSSNWKTWILSAAFWLGIGTVFTVQGFYAFDEEQKGEVLQKRLLEQQVWNYAPLVVLTPFVFDLCARFPLGRGRRRNGLALAAGGVGFVLAHGLLRTLFESVLLDTEPAPSGFLSLIANNVAFHLFRYGTIVGVAHAVGYARNLRERDREASDLRRQLVEAQLSALKMQLQPHFLFNALHAVSVFARRDPDEAARMIALLGDLLRRTLDERARQVVPLREELDFLRLYLEIQRMRFQDRLKIEYEVGPETLDCLVPNLVLQPLAENAVRHGVESRAGSGVIRITAEMTDGWLTLKVLDDGVGTKNGISPFAREGVGLGNTRERLRKLYGDAQDLRLEAVPTGGVAAIVRLRAARDSAEHGR